MEFDVSSPDILSFLSFYLLGVGWMSGRPAAIDVLKSTL